MTRIFLIGYPGNVGGACTEAWHTLRLWREGGLDVHVLPTWGNDSLWEAKLDLLGIPTHHVPHQELESFALLRDSVAVGMCNEHFLCHSPTLRGMGCRLVWVGCMTWRFDAEPVLYEKHGLFDAYVFQTAFQKELLEKDLVPFGYDAARGHLIRGAFFADEWEFAPRPHGGGEPFVVGRLSRADPAKWSPELWQTYEQISFRPLRARVMGWRPRLKRQCGRPPEWVETLNVEECAVVPFLQSLHCLLPINGGAQENWPRVGLEAMAAGVPIVTEKRWGWLEMVSHGRTGFLGETNEELAQYATELAQNENLRLAMAHAARQHVEQLSDPQPIWREWKRLFDSLEGT